MDRPGSPSRIASSSAPAIEDEEESTALAPHSCSASELTLGPTIRPLSVSTPTSSAAPTYSAALQSVLGRGAPPSSTTASSGFIAVSQNRLDRATSATRTPGTLPTDATSSMASSSTTTSGLPPSPRRPPGILQNPTPSMRERQLSTSSTTLGPGVRPIVQGSGASTYSYHSAAGVRGYPGGDTTETESILSEDPSEYSDSQAPWEQTRPSRSALAPPATASSISTSTIGGATRSLPGGTGDKGKGLPLGPLRSASTAPPIHRHRSKSRVRARGSDEDDDEMNPGGVERRAMSPAPGGRLLGASAGLDEDDEVERRDRGEELVRKRMKDRARVKKEAERAEKSRKKELLDARARLQLDPTRRISYATAPPTAELEGDFSVGAPPPRSAGLDPSLGYGIAPTFLRSRSRDPSRSGVRESTFSTESSDLGARSEADTERGHISPGLLPELSWPQPPASAVVASSPTARITTRRPSYASTCNRTVDDDPQRDVFFDPPVVAEERHDEEREPTDAGDLDDGDAGDEPSDRDGDENEDEDEDEDANSGGEVEYTLKDRQDAINIEHPFGLPIWKPALYKKSRSVTRNAETALHATPSSTALRHLAPGNILWTLFFGIWLAIVCAAVSAVLWCVPWGGEKYGRVIWELGGYLFWPFGKYVEGWSDQVGLSPDGDDEEDENRYADEIGEDEDEDEDDEEADTNGTRRPPFDLEDAGRTYRGRPRTVSGDSGSFSAQQTLRGSVRADQIWNGDGDGDGRLPDEPQASTPTTDGQTTPVPQAFPGSSTNESRPLLGASTASSYGTARGDKTPRSSSEDTISRVHLRPHDFSKDDDGKHSFRVRALGRTMYWVGFYLVVAPLMLVVCILCWGMVFTIPMAKLLWVLLRHLNNEPLSLHFRSPPKYTVSSPPSGDLNGSAVDGIQYPLRAGQRAPRVSRKSVRAAKAHGRLFGPRSTVLLCTYRAAGVQYYKYTIDGVNIMFINLLSLVFFVIADFWWVEPYVEKHELGGLLGFISGQAFIFVIALLSVIPLSYFIGMAVASISAQSSIGMGAVINASFGSIIEIILYCIALTQSKGDLVEGSIVGSILAGVLLMPGLSMIGGAMRRKEQKFNAKSAGVTSTMLIMAIIGILTPTLFYEIYGSFQLTCTGCDPDRSGTTTSCSTCYYEHVDPVDDPFYKTSVRLLSYWCAVILVFSYLVGLWFSLRTHASQIWQNAQPSHEQGLPRPLTAHIANPERLSLYKRIVPSQLIPNKRSSVSGGTPLTTPAITPRPGQGKTETAIPAMELPHGMTVEDLSHAFQVVTATADAIRSRPPAALQRQSSHAREPSANKVDENEPHGGHDAPNWSRFKSASVLMGCTVLYAVIAEILVDVVDVVLDGSGIPEKFLGVTLFALVPNTTEFMNAISFAINGNIALSMEIGSAYALQVCLIQAPAMLAFSAYYGIGKEVLNHRSFTLVFPRWDVIAIIFSVFLLTYTYIEARANYYRGSILCLSYLVLIGGFAFAPSSPHAVPTTPVGFAGEPVHYSLSTIEMAKAMFFTLFSR